jgi:type I restriction enzyme S subunit
MLKDVCRITNGGTPKSGVESLWHGDVAWLTPAEMGKRLTPYIEKTARTISQEGLANSSAKLVPPGSVILSTRAPIGHLAINESPMAFNQGCRGLTPGEKLDVKYLYYFLYFSRDALDGLGTGTTFKELSSSNLANFKIPLPSLNEQRRIVAVLDKAFAGIATATANAQKNLTNARMLFETYLESVMSEARKLGKVLFLREVCTFENGDRGENYPGRESFVPKGIPVINAGHLSPAGIDAAEMNFIARERFNVLRSGKVRLGDILFCLRGSLGKFAVNEIYEEGAIASSLVIIRPKEAILTKFLAAYLQSGMCKSMISKYKNGTAQPNLGGKSLELFLIPVPSLDAQENLVRKIEGISRSVSSHANNSSIRLSALSELKQSLLQKAFSGELP